MKKFFVSLGLMAGLCTFATGCDPLHYVTNQAGKDQYYVKINKEPEIKQEKTKEGRIVKDHLYTLKGYDEKGNEEEITFDGLKVLKQNAYLRLYVKDKKVSSYEEVQEKEIPSKAQEKLK